MARREQLSGEPRTEGESCGTRVSRRRSASIKARLRQKQTAQARLEAAMEPTKYGPGGSEVGRHPVTETIDELMARIRARAAAEAAK